MCYTVGSSGQTYTQARFIYNGTTRHIGTVGSGVNVNTTTTNDLNVTGQWTTAATANTITTTNVTIEVRDDADW